MDSKSSLPGHQPFIPSYSQPILNLQQQQPPAQTLYNPNLSHQVSSPNQNSPNTSTTIPTYQPMPNLHYQQLPTSNQSQFSNYPPINQPSAQIGGYPMHGPPQSQFNPHSMYSPPIGSQQFTHPTSPPPASSPNIQHQQQQSFIHNLPAQQTPASVHTPPPVPQAPRDASPVPPGPPQSNLAGPPSSLPSQQSHLPAQTVSPPTSQPQSNYSFTTPLNLPPGMPPLNVRLDSSKIPLNNLETIIGNSNTQ